MKILTIGLDGGDKRIIRAMSMPYLHKLLDQNVCLDLEEDLWSRGWVKILSGVPGYESGAFYAKPKLDGTHDTTNKFSTSDYNNNSDINPLWARLSERGHTVGFMNVPSMMPAPEVKGFAVSGGGAGAATSGSTIIPVEACHPKDIREILEKNGYILDLRTVSSGIKDIDQFFNQLLMMTQLRTAAFLNLQGRFSIQYGFVAYMAFNRTQNLAMSEIEPLIQNNCNPANPFQERLVQFYAQMDEQIGKLITELSPQNIMLVSDHGQSPRLYSVNVNNWLRQTGLQVPLAQSMSLMKQTAKTIARFMPQGIKNRISKTAPGLKEKVGGGINADWSQTKAFGVRYVPGIYINDQKRFNGPVQIDEYKQSLVHEIIDKFNNDQAAKEHGFFARAYRQKYSHARYEALLPDIWIDHPDTYFFEQHGEFIESNKDYGPIKSLEQVDRDMFTGIKGRHPLLCVSPGLTELAGEDDQRDLTLAYKLITRGMDA
ncbi:MAG: alkaline phosphatase family protein [Desulfotomaculaceae bacterium]|nr:alkaline phosphatase family protein [Desulfotomaculaceae bacterium]